MIINVLCRNTCKGYRIEAVGDDSKLKSIFAEAETLHDAETQFIINVTTALGNEDIRIRPADIDLQYVLTHQEEPCQPTSSPNPTAPSV